MSNFNKKSHETVMSYRKRVTAILLTTLCGINATPAMALGFSKPYVGFDIQERQMKYKKDFGANMLKDTSPQGNLYVGVKLKDSLALELGFEAARTKSRTVTLYAGDVAAGMTISAAMSPYIVKSMAKVRGPHVDLVGFYGFEADPAFKLLGSVGVGVFRGYYERNVLQMGPTATPGIVRTLSKNKAITRLIGGMQYMLGEHIGTRLTAGWVNTTRVSAQSNDGMRTLFFKPRNTVSYGMGMFWVF